MQRIRNKPGEVWLEIFPGQYKLSNMGRWYSIRSQKILHQYKNSSGYYRAHLVVNGEKRRIFTHIEVVARFGDCNNNKIPLNGCLIANGLSIDHLDSNKRHNHFSNLEIVTHKENCLRREQRRRCRIKAKEDCNDIVALAKGV